MSRPIEDYGLIGNMVTSALVGRDGSIDWLCVPRFDSDACFAALLGTPENGRWRLYPTAPVRRTRRRYLPGTAVLETVFETDDGAVALIDFMPPNATEHHGELIRIVRGLSGRVEMSMEFALRFGYGRTVPWVRRRDYGLCAVAGPDACDLVTPVPLQGKDMMTVARFTVGKGESAPFTMAYYPSQSEPRFIEDRSIVLDRTIRWWRDWVGRSTLPEGGKEEWRDALIRSLITLKAMTYHPSGGIVAAPTTSLPEHIGGVRNWDYRFCWIRDATLTVYALVNSGHYEEADAFRLWLMRAAAGDPAQMQIMYGLGGERRLTESEISWLPGYENSRPVRIGNGAHEQLQLDVYGELIDALHAARQSHLGSFQAAWQFQCTLLTALEKLWRQPDAGIWEVRGAARHFTYSKMMAWVAFDRGIQAVEQYRLDGPVARWRAVRAEIRAEIEAEAYDAGRNCFVQSYGSHSLDASLLLMAETGFLDPADPRFRGTVEAIEKDLMEDGFVLRYRPEDTDDGLAGEEGSFVLCSFWLVNAYVLLKRYDDASALFERLLGVANDLGLLAEQYDPKAKRQLGNFPQAFSHIGLITAAQNLLQAAGPAEQRANRDDAGTAPVANDRAAAAPSE